LSTIQVLAGREKNNEGDEKGKYGWEREKGGVEKTFGGRTFVPVLLEHICYKTKSAKEKT